MGQGWAILLKWSVPLISEHPTNACQVFRAFYLVRFPGVVWDCLAHKEVLSKFIIPVHLWHPLKWRKLQTLILFFYWERQMKAWVPSKKQQQKWLVFSQEGAEVRVEGPLPGDKPKLICVPPTLHYLPVLTQQQDHTLWEIKPTTHERNIRWYCISSHENDCWYRQSTNPEECH